jgi:hypothetical protein
LVDKAAVLAALARKEAAAVSDEVVRTRLKNLNAGLSRVASEVHGVERPFLTIRSRKSAFLIDLGPGASGLVRRQRTRAVVGQAAREDRTLPDDLFVEASVAKLTYRVFVSHGHEDAEVEGIVTDFAQKLRHKLAHLPHRWKDRFALRLWIDHDKMSARGEFDAQADEICHGSAFAIFLTSAKWLGSGLCQRERRHFERRDLSGVSRLFLCV